LRRIFGPKRDEVTGEWRKLHSEGLHHLFSSPTIVQVITLRMTRTGYIARLEEGRDVYMVFLGRPEGKRSLGRTRRRWEDNGE
jgi:hypothetical protein